MGIQLSFSGAPVPVRADLCASQERAWQRLSQPGTWWTGAERVAIADEVRRARSCATCRQRKEALSPEAVQGGHDSAGSLPEAVVDVVHRITTDPARLSRGWCEKTLAGVLSDAHYVELVGVVVTVVSIDSFCRAVGMPLHPLPDAQPGEPTRRRPESARAEAAWVPMIPPNGAQGEEADLWSSPSRTANVFRALSLVPDEVRGNNDLFATHYLSFEKMMNLKNGRAIDRRQMELVAARVSALNECFY